MADERDLMRLCGDLGEGGGWMGPALGVLYGIALGHGARSIVEIGVWRGASTRAFLLVAARLGGRVASIDVEDCSQAVPEDLRARWTFLRGRSQDIGRAWWKPIDLLYIDGQHDHDGASSDLRNFGCHVVSGGLIVMDDCWEAWPGVLRAFREFPDDQCEYKHLIPYGVPGAWDGDHRTLGLIRKRRGA